MNKSNDTKSINSFLTPTVSVFGIDEIDDSR